MYNVLTHAACHKPNRKLDYIFFMPIKLLHMRNGISVRLIEHCRMSVAGSAMGTHWETRALCN